MTSIFKALNSDTRTSKRLMASYFERYFSLKDDMYIYIARYANLPLLWPSQLAGIIINLQGLPKTWHG